jgi:hypothetical protein
MGKEIGNASFSVRDGDRIRIGHDIDVLIYKRPDRGGYRALVQAPKEVNIRLVKRPPRAAATQKGDKDERS